MEVQVNAAAASTLEADGRLCARLARHAAAVAPARSCLQPADLEHHRTALMRYAQRRMRNRADAEDAVQETLIAALTARDGFAGQASVATWLHGILKHKIVDIHRRQARETLLDAEAVLELADEVDAMFTPAGAWREAPPSWGNPEAALDRRDFRRVLESCLEGLPAACARAFRMRELMELETPEICAALGITEDNCYVMLHRARMRLRALLERRWFAGAAGARGGQAASRGNSANL